MNADGNGKKMITDGGAWGARWTADGRSLVFRGGVDNNGKKLKKNYLRIYDLQTATFRDAFTSQTSPFSKMSFYFDCSAQGRMVAFGGTQLELPRKPHSNH